MSLGSEFGSSASRVLPVSTVCIFGLWPAAVKMICCLLSRLDAWYLNSVLTLCGNICLPAVIQNILKHITWSSVSSCWLTGRRCRVRPNCLHWTQTCWHDAKLCFVTFLLLYVTSDAFGATSDTNSRDGFSQYLPSASICPLLSGAAVCLGILKGNS